MDFISLTDFDSKSTIVFNVHNIIAIGNYSQVEPNGQGSYITTLINTQRVRENIHTIKMKLNGEIH